MENYPFPLSSVSDSWLKLSSSAWVTDLILGILCGLGLFLLLLPCLGSGPSSPPARQKRSVRKADRRERPRSRKRSGPLKAYRDCRRELDGAWDLTLLLQSCQVKLPDKGGSHQLSCPDPPGEECNPAPASAHRPRAERVQDASPTTSSPLASPAPLAQSPPPLASTLSPGPTASPVCAGSSQSSLSAARPPEPLLPPERPSPQPQALSPPTPRSPAPVACPLPPPDSSLAHAQCDSMAPPLGTVPQSYSPHYNNCWLPPPVSKISDLSCTSDTVSALTWWQVAARTGRAWSLSASAESKSQQGHLSNRPPEASSWGDATHRQMEGRGPSFIHTDVQDLLETLMGKRKENEKEGSSLKQVSPDYPRGCLGNMVKSPSGDQDTTPQRFCNMTDKPEQLPGPQQLSHPKAKGDHLQQKCTQLFWGLPSLHSESLVAAVRVSGPPLNFPSVLFNGFPNSFGVHPHPQLFLPQSWPHHRALPQLPLAGFQPQICLPHSLLTPHFCSPQIPFCGAFCPTVRREAQFPLSTAVQQLECHFLKKQQESRRALPTIVKNSQEVFHQLTSDRWTSQTYKSVSSSSEDIINPGLWGQHPRISSTRHRATLPRRNQPSLGRAQPWGRFPRAGQAKEKQGDSWSSAYTGGSSQDIQDMESKGPAIFQIWKHPSLKPGHCPESDSNLSCNSNRSLVVLPRASSQEESESSRMKPSSDTRHDLPDKGHVEDILKVHLSRKLGQIKQGRIPVSICHSRLANDQALAPFENSNMHIETRTLASSKGRESSEDTSQGLLDPGRKHALEAHVRRLQVRHKWGLPLKILKTKNLFMLKKAQPPPLPLSTFSSWATCESGDNSTTEVVKFLGEDPQEGPGEKITEKSVLTQIGPHPATSPVGENVQMDLRGTQSGDNRGHSEALSTGQKGRWPSQPLTSRTRHSEMFLGARRGSPELSPGSAMARSEPWEEEKSVASGDFHCTESMQQLTLGSQSSGAKKTIKPVKAKKKKPPAWEAILGTSMRADSHRFNVSLSSGSLSNSNSSQSFIVYVPQNPEELCLNAPRVGACQNQPQGLAPNVLLQDYTTGVLLGNYDPDVLGVDIWAFPATLSSSHSKSTADTGWPCESQSKRSGPTDKRERCRRPKPGGQKQRSARPRTSQTNGISHPSQDRELAESPRSKSSQLLPNEGQAPTGSRFRNKTRQFLQWIFPKKNTGEGEPVQNREPASATAQCLGRVTGRSCTDARMDKVRGLVTTVGQILEEETGPNHELPVSKGNRYREELQATVGGSCSHHRGPSQPEKRRVMSDTACNHQATPVGHSSPVKNRWVRDKNSNQASPARPCQHRPRVARASSYPIGCPRHCCLPKGVLPGQPDHTSPTFPGEQTFLSEEVQFRQRKRVLSYGSTSPMC
nr:spermatogenesis-associated protein 31E1-like [Microcebus murinus]